MEEKSTRHIFHPHVIGCIVFFFFGFLIAIFIGHSTILGQQKEVLAAKIGPTATPNPTVTPTPSPSPTPTPSPSPTPSPTPSPSPTPVPTASPEDTATWDKLAQCETHGNWAEDTGNGYFGGLQFNQSAWNSVGGSGKPSDASRDEQILRGKTLQSQRGWGAWSDCAKRLGLY